MLVATLIAALLTTVGWSLGSTGAIDPVGVMFGIIAVVVVSIALVVGGRRSAQSWIVAALFYQALGGLRNAAYAQMWQERGRGVLIAILASGLIALIAQRTARARETALTNI